MLNENSLALFGEPALFWCFFDSIINFIAPFTIWLDFSYNLWLLLLNLGTLISKPVVTSGNPCLSGVLYMYILICTHSYKTPLCFLIHDIGIYLSDLYTMKKESEPQ